MVFTHNTFNIFDKGCLVCLKLSQFQYCISPFETASMRQLLKIDSQVLALLSILFIAMEKNHPSERNVELLNQYADLMAVIKRFNVSFNDNFADKSAFVCIFCSFKEINSDCN